MGRLRWSLSHPRRFVWLPRCFIFPVHSILLLLYHTAGGFGGHSRDLYYNGIITGKGEREKDTQREDRDSSPGIAYQLYTYALLMAEGGF